MKRGPGLVPAATERGEETMNDSKHSSATAPRRPMTVPRILDKKANGEKITVVTAYDATFARIFDDAGVDILLVGDSLGMVVQGRDSTLPVTVDEMIYHGSSVARGSRFAHIVIDLPFMSYQPSVELAMKNAGRLLAEGGGHAVKIEGGAEIAETIRSVASAGVPVMGHVGLTPQSVHAMGGFRVQGRTRAAAKRVLEDARAVAEAGAYAIVLEGIPNDLAREISESLSIPTIGIGAGPDCDGQVLVSYDLLGLTPTLRPKFVKRFAELFDEAKRATEEYIREVRGGSFPSEEYTFGDVRQDGEQPEKSLKKPSKEGGGADSNEPPSERGYGPQ